VTDSDLPADARDLPIPDSALAHAADRTDVAVGELVDALVVLDADLRGRHSTYEVDHDYVTVDGVRAYLADGDAWESLVTEFDLDGDIEDGAREAHTEGARLLYDRSVEEHGRFTEEVVGIVVGVDTAEEMT